VDNAFIDVAAAVPSLYPDDPIVLNESIEAGLFCEPSNADCAWVGYEVDVQRCGGTARVQLRRHDNRAQMSTVLGTDIVGLDGDGRFVARFSPFDLGLPVVYSGEHSIEPMPLLRAMASGVLTADAINDLVIAGAIHRREVIAALPPFYCDPSFCDPPPVPDDALFDVMTDPASAMCDGLSVGFIANAELLNLDD